ncbi:GAF domain-containing protein [Croceicoccus sp. F390]|uniref:GAF domain-containing protein n=1 Tax=Croceicoccus esteveae TaxID=3075597 RepID=A0ABU2ZHZ4_9SPHN|nr:GAF domain-containing protein [Croceicoccus sp. F390]MDT0576232.1 GAF domain-containing protein [Croceicoccus sp. F390]
MFEMRPTDRSDKALLYRELYEAVDAITDGETDQIANMANTAALIWGFVPDLNWAGFYRLAGEELVLGPFQGSAACIRIPMGRGVCGMAALQQRSVLVPDVHAFEGHIACDANSRSELVVPIVSNRDTVAVLDCDSPLLGRFDKDDQAGLERIASLLAARLAR